MRSSQQDPEAQRPELLPQAARPAPARRAVVVGLAAGGLLLLLALVFRTHEPGAPPDPATTAAERPSAGDARLKVSPYVKASRERAQAQRPEHRPRLQLTVIGAQKSGR